MTPQELLEKLAKTTKGFSCPKELIPLAFQMMDRLYIAGDFNFLFIGKGAYVKRTKPFIKRAFPETT